MGKRKPKQEKRTSIISVRTTPKEKREILQSVKKLKSLGIQSMSDLLLYAYKKLVE